MEHLRSDLVPLPRGHPHLLHPGARLWSDLRRIPPQGPRQGHRHHERGAAAGPAHWAGAGRPAGAVRLVAVLVPPAVGGCDCGHAAVPLPRRRDNRPDEEGEDVARQPYPSLQAALHEAEGACRWYYGQPLARPDAADELRHLHCNAVYLWPHGLPGGAHDGAGRPRQRGRLLRGWSHGRLGQAQEGHWRPPHLLAQCVCLRVLRLPALWLHLRAALDLPGRLLVHWRILPHLVLAWRNDLLHRAESPKPRHRDSRPQRLHVHHGVHRPVGGAAHLRGHWHVDRLRLGLPPALHPAAGRMRHRWRAHVQGLQGPRGKPLQPLEAALAAPAALFSSCPAAMYCSQVITRVPCLYSCACRAPAYAAGGSVHEMRVFRPLWSLSMALPWYG
mmetsp:Transcript_9138/g.37670  ORF Transcript_9138/g.37670 Transcript_9138/m.37670 type:complete len:388 (-) Transcript_9138:1325-2488(-)